ncbi:ABC transporter substrate-binding protein [Salana multivorans]|nr:sugar ABC transporter substrate-binding protein [Salana multivorans]MBN8882321.1 sugar ABC transporter substrate-binding protein [Salana multivorans]
MRIARRHAGIVLAGAVALTLAACGSGSTGGGGGTAGSDGGSTDGAGGSAGGGEKVTLRWAMSADSQAEVDVWNHLADMVTEAYPEIEVTFESTPYREYYNKLTAQAASNDLACIAGLQAQRVSDVGSLFVDLAPYFEQTGFDIADYSESIVEGLTSDGAQLAVPYDFGPFVVYVNKDLFDAAGLEQPQPGWTFEEFIAAAEALTKDGTYGWAVNGSPDAWLGWALSVGGVYMADGEPTLTDPGVVDGFGREVSLVTEYGVAQAPDASGQAGGASDLWRNGRAAMYIDGPWQLINARTTVDFEVGLTTLPSVDGTSITTMSGTGFGITSSCKNPDEAWKAISVIIGPEAQQYIADAGRGFPAYTAAQESWYETAGVDGAREAIETALETVDPYPTPAGWQQVSALLVQYSTEAFSGARTPAQVLELVQQQAG